MGRLKRLAGLSVVAGPDWPGVAYFCTTRIGGVSKEPWSSLNMGLHTGDNPGDVLQNRHRILPRERSVFWLNQVHGTDVVDADGYRPVHEAAASVDTSGSHEMVSADALVSATPGQVLAIMTADCLPVVLGSTDGQVVGVAHAGWRGLAAGVLENTLAALQRKHPEPVAQWRAWVGPGISAPCFEVGDDVRDAFVVVDPAMSSFFESTGRPGKWLADLSGLASHRLYNSGVVQVDVSAFCTYRRPDLFYSYRRDGVTGRMATLAWVEPEA